jgi:hypothetical protein
VQNGVVTATSSARDAESPLAFPALLVVAAALRIFFDNVTVFFPSDETVYLCFTRTLAEGGASAYPRLVQTFIADRGGWIFPSPLRWAYLGASTLFCSASGACTHRALATLSTVAGIAAVALTYWLGLRLFDRPAALIATALMATSPLQLAMGRRALADELFCAMALASFVALVEWTHRRHVAWLAAWVVLTTLTIAVKEQFLFIYPVVLLFWWLHERKIRWVWVLPPFLFLAIFCLLARDVTSFFRIARIVTSEMGAPYAEQLQNGWPHRVVIDLLAVAPLVIIAAIAAAASVRMTEQRRLLVLAGGILAVHALLSSKNLRYLIPADPLLRLLVASWLPRGRWWTVALIANAAIELAIFHAVFVTAAVYDPTTSELLRALKMLPH